MWCSDLRQYATLGLCHTQRTALQLFDQVPNHGPGPDDGDGQIAYTCRQMTVG